MFSSGNLQTLPKSIGPGPLNLVMKAVLEKLIKIAYKPSRVLREIQYMGDNNNSNARTTLKAK